MLDEATRPEDVEEILGKIPDFDALQIWYGGSWLNGCAKQKKHEIS